MWTDTLQFNSTDSMMRIQVYDEDTFSSDDLIGDGTLNLNQFYQNPMRTENGKFKFNVEYVDLVCRGKSAGRLLLSI
jgi:Ca2+-dependent lipid-binding protein